VRDATRLAERTLGPLLDLFIRLWLAGIFWASGMVKLQSWNIALYLSAHEYPVSWCRRMRLSTDNAPGP
jgi:NADH dehydrogenase/putative oxidoreductase